MSDKGWKKRERRIASRLGTKRIPVTGERHGADCETAMFCVQVKSRQRGLPAEVLEWLRGVQANAAPKGKIGILVCALPHHRDSDAVVCLSLRDWVALHGPVTEATPEPPKDLAPEDFGESLGDA